MCHIDHVVAFQVLTTPAVRRMVREHDLDLSLIKGTGKDGRVLKEDVLASMEGMLGWVERGHSATYTMHPHPHTPTHTL
jgi:2-oxoisovalerate dehydrogenase E2 component (dihydrolipoyl transacylase)